jgi:hypothetical protein
LGKEAEAILSSILAAASGSDSMQQKAHVICVKCVLIYTAEGSFGRLYATTNERLRSIPEVPGRDPDGIMNAILKATGDLYPFVRVLWMGLKTVFPSVEASLPTVAYAGGAAASSV